MTTRDQCRYLSRHGNQCTGIPIDSSEEAEVLLCQRHVAGVVQLFKAKGFALTATEGPDCCPNCQHESCVCPSLEQVPYGGMPGEPGIVR